MLHLLGRGIQPEWNEEKHDIERSLLFCVIGEFTTQNG